MPKRIHRSRLRQQVRHDRWRCHPELDSGSNHIVEGLKKICEYTG